MFVVALFSALIEEGLNVAYVAKRSANLTTINKIALLVLRRLAQFYSRSNCMLITFAEYYGSPEVTK